MGTNNKSKVNVKKKMIQVKFAYTFLSFIVPLVKPVRQSLPINRELLLWCY